MLKLDSLKIQKGRDISKNIAEKIDVFIADKTTVSVERAVLRFFDIDGVDKNEVPLVNVVIKHAKKKGLLNDGIALHVTNACLQYNLSPQQVSVAISEGQLDLSQCTFRSELDIKKEARNMINKKLDYVEHRNERKKLIKRSQGNKPLLYVIVATGDIYEDIVQAKAAATQGADIIAVIRSTGQSLLDYVPYGPTREGFGGTYATQENFRLIRYALDEVGEQEGRYIGLCNYCSGLCMPEIAVMGALEGLDVMLNDALYGILFRDINMQRTLVDQYFSRMINSHAKIIINTGEDNYLTTADAVASAHTVLASQLINEQLAFFSGLPSEQMGLGHAFEMNPDTKNGFLLELAQAQMIRQIFPSAPLKYMPPTKHMTGNIFKGHIQDALFNVVGIWTNQGIQLLGMMSEAMHTPHIQDRQLAIENAQYIFENMKDLGQEIKFKSDGIIQKRASKVLNEAVNMLEEISEQGFFESLEKGILADVKRTRMGGKGLEGVLTRSSDYFNPLEDELRIRLGLKERVYIV